MPAPLGAKMLASGDIETAVCDAHDLIALAGRCGARSLSNLARTIEHAVRRGDAPDAASQYAEFCGACSAATKPREDMLRA